MSQRVGIYGRQSRGKTKSIDEQIAECTADVERDGHQVVATYTDLVSASRYGSRQRGDHAKLLADVAAGNLDMVATWSPDRADRNLTTWSGFLDSCREHRVLIRVTDHDHTYDMAKARDWRQLAEDGIDAAYFSEKLSSAVTRGVGGAARSGRPPMGPCPFGYRRLYDSSTGELIRQEPDPQTAPVVRGIFDEVARSVPLVKVVARLNAEGIPPPGTASHRTGSKRWYRMRVREMVLNPAYIGKRRHRNRGRNATGRPELYDATWEPLISEETFWAASHVLTQPGRLAMARPGRQKHLLSYLAVCHRDHPIRGQVQAYCCQSGCVWVPRGPADRLVRGAMIAFLSRDDVYALLRQAGEDADREVLAARDEVARLRADLDRWRLSAARGPTTPETMAVVEAELTRQIREADRRAERAAIPPALRQVLEPGRDVAQRWDDAPIAARRDLIRALVVVQLHPAGRDHTVSIADRVRITPRSR